MEQTRDNATAIFVSDNGIETWIMPNQWSKIGYLHTPSNAKGNPYTRDAAQVLLHVLQDDKCIKSPIGDTYHVWHICTCPKCSQTSAGDIYGTVLGGRVFDHSQGAWNDHLKTVDDREIMTYNTPNG